MDEAPASAARTLTCKRHKGVETPLTCVTCGDAICPQCYVRTAVGLRCPVCAQGVTVRVKRGRARWPFVAVGLAVAVVIGGLLLKSGGSSGSKGPSGDAAGEDPTVPSGAAPGYQVVSRPQLGYSVEIPRTWQASADNSETFLAYSEPRSNEGSLRVSVNQTQAAVADVIQGLTGQLAAQGGADFTQTPVQVSGLPGARLDYTFPVNDTPGAARASRSSYFVKEGDKVFSFQLATTDPAGKGTVFAYISSKFTLL